MENGNEGKPTSRGRGDAFTHGSEAPIVGAVIDPELRRLRADRFRRIEAAEWKRLMPKLVTLAMRRLGSTARLADAEDLAQEAVAKAIASMERWDPETTPLLRFVGSFLNGEALNRRRKRSVKDELLGIDDDQFVDGPYSDESHTDVADEPGARRAGAHTIGFGSGAMVSRDLARKVVEKLSTRLAGDEIAWSVLEAFHEGIDTPREQAAEIGCSLAAIHTARKRLARHADKVIAELEGN